MDTRNTRLFTLLLLGALLPLTALAFSATRHRDQELREQNASVEAREAQVNDKIDARQRQLLVDLRDAARSRGVNDQGVW